MRRILLACLVLSILALATSCSNDDATAPEPVPATQAAANIPPAGGSVTVENEAGARLTVSFPAGAVMEPTRVTIRAAATPAGMRARFAVTPSGLDLHEPATFTLVLPDGAPVPGNLGISFERSQRVPVPTDVDTDARTLRCSIMHLGFGDLSAVTTTRASTTAAEGDEFINIESFECQLLQESLTDAILRAQAWSGPFPPDLASPLIQEYRAALLACGPDSLADTQAALQAIACDKVEGATLNAQVFLVETAQDLKTSLGFLMAAAGVAQTVDADCEVENALLETEFNEFLEAYITRIESPGFTASFPNWDALWRELITCLDVAAMAQEFSVPQAETTIYHSLFPALFSRLYQVALDACAEEENKQFLIDILTGGHELNHAVIPAREMPSYAGLQVSDLLDALHRCGSSITVDAKTQANETLDSSSVPLDNHSGSLRVTRDGKIEIVSNVLSFTCGGIVSRPPIRVRAEIPNNLPVVQLGTLSGQMTVNVASIISALPAPGGVTPRNFDLVFERDLAVCGVGGPGAVELCRVSVNSSGFEGAISGSWSGCGQSGTFDITIAADGTVTGTFAGTASGTIDGNVTANGALAADASGGAGGCTWSGTVTLSGGSLSTSGSWSCDGGCSGGFAGS